MSNFVRSLVSKKKRRYKEDGYNLDLAYIGKKIIAMGYPSSGFESFYRNPFSEVKKFLDEKHKGNYFVYNLCSERDYDKSCFDGRVEKYPFDDHNPPKFDLIRQFCISATKWLEEDPKHIIVVHCKAGKGRTGVMITALLLYQHKFDTPEEALEYYGKKRTYNGKGVTIPSQIRFIRYFHRFLNSGLPFDRPLVERPCYITIVHFRNVPEPYFTRDLVLEISSQDEETIYYKGPGNNPKGPRKDSEHNTLTYKLDKVFTDEITGDFRIAALFEGKIAWFIWFNSEYIQDQEIFTKECIDKANKSKEFPKNFKLSVFAHH